MRAAFAFLIAVLAIGCLAADATRPPVPGIRVKPKPKPFAIAGSGTDVQFAWDASENADTNIVVTNYVLYVHTNNLHVVERSESIFKINAGTNLTAVAPGLKPVSIWYVAVSAQATYAVSGQPVTVLESDLSNMIILGIPNPPQNNRVIMEYSMTLSNFTDMGYWRLRIEGPP